MPLYDHNINLRIPKSSLSLHLNQNQLLLNSFKMHSAIQQQYSFSWHQIVMLHKGKIKKSNIAYQQICRMVWKILKSQKEKYILENAMQVFISKATKKIKIKVAIPSYFC